MSKEPLCESPVPAFYNPLVSVTVDPTLPHLDRVLCQQLTDRAHELTTGVNLERFGPLQWTSPVDARKSFGNLLGLFCGQNHSECIFVCARLSSVVWQEKQVALMDLVWYIHVKLWLKYVSLGSEVDLPDGLLLQPSPGHIYRYLGCG